MRRLRKFQQFLENIRRVRLEVRPQLAHEEEYNTGRGTDVSSLNAIVCLLKTSPNARFISRIALNGVSVQEFKRRFEKPRIPVLIRETGWKQSHSRSPSSPGFVTVTKFLKLFQDEYLECGDSSEGFCIEIKLKDFLRYQRCFRDEYPLYIFDGSVHDWKHPRNKLNIIKKMFAPPKFFTSDYMAHLGKKIRPPWRWLLIGPKHSGTGIHIDPLGTSAWNRLLIGEKLWLLFPPDTPTDLLGRESTNIEEASQWVTFMYAKTQYDSWPEEFKPLHVLQRPGDVVFIPAGWWHLVLNLKVSFAVTQNFVSKENLSLAWKRTLQERPDLAKVWLNVLLKNSVIQSKMGYKIENSSWN